MHRAIGPGVFENVYTECLKDELRDAGFRFVAERPVPLVYKGRPLKMRFYVDLVVEDQVVVELKAVAEVAEIHKRQVLTQLKLADLPVGLLMNFNVLLLTDGGVKRIVNPTAPALAERE